MKFSQQNSALAPFLQGDHGTERKKDGAKKGGMQGSEKSRIKKVDLHERIC